MQGAKVLQLNEKGVYVEIPISTRPVVYNHATGTYKEYVSGQILNNNERITDRWVIK